MSSSKADWFKLLAARTQQPVASSIKTRTRNAVARNGRNDDLSPRSTQLEERLDRKESSLSLNRRQLVRRIADEAEETYFLSSRELAKRYKVDVGTIVRTIQALGYRHYADFISDLRAHFVSRLNPYTAMKTATRKGRRSVPDHVRDCVDLAANNLSALQSELDPKQLMELARRISRARRIVIVGVDLAAALAYYFSYLLVAFGFDAEAPAGSVTQINQKIAVLAQADLLIAISFGRCLRTTVDAAIRAHRRGVPTFGITDSNRSPIARFCDTSLITPIASTELSVTYVAPMSAIEAVLTACAYLNPRRTLNVLKRKEDEDRKTRWYSSDEEDRKRKK
jgi:DNA-binding MurR/RpiR family transcriptional regulator